MPALTTVTRTLVRALAIPALAASMVLAQAAARPPVPIARAQPPPATPSAEGPCSIVDAAATTDPAAVPIGGTVRLTLSWRWRCSGERSQRDVLVVADPSSALAEIDPHAHVFLHSLHLALASFADRVGSAGSHRFGTVLAGCPATVPAPLASGAAAHDAWRAGLANFPVTKQRDMLGALDLARQALVDHPPATDRPAPVVVVVDSGGSECGGGAQPATTAYEAACQRVRDTGATVAVVATRRSQGRLGRCNSPGWLFRSSSDSGTDLPAILNEVFERTEVPGAPTTAETRIALATSDWDLVQTVPTADVTFPEVLWLQPVEQAESGAVAVSAVLRAGRDAITGRRQVAVEGLGGPSAGLRGPEGNVTTIDFDAPPVCIYARGHGMAECGVREPIFLPFGVR